MSHPLYNPYASESQSSSQGQYGFPSLQSPIDPRRTASRLGPGSSFSSSGASSALSESRGMFSSAMPQSANYRPEHSRTIKDDDLERSVDLHISRAREEARVLSSQMHQPIDQDIHFTSTQRNDFGSSDKGMGSYAASSLTSVGHNRSDFESGSSSLDWSLNYKRPTADDSKYYSSSSSSSYSRGGDGRFTTSSEREKEMQSIPGLGDYPVAKNSVAPPDSSQPKYTSQSAANILKHFGLEKEDLEHLISYPEDEITPSNLPFILRQIRIQKTKRATASGQAMSLPYPESQPTRRQATSQPYPESQPTRRQPTSQPYLESQPTRRQAVSQPYPEPLATSGRAEMDSLNTSSGSGMRPEKMSSAILKPSKVIDYGHTGKYTGAVGDEIGKNSGSRASSGGDENMLKMEPYDSSRLYREPLQKSTAEVNSTAQASSVTGVSQFLYTSVLKSVAPSCHDQTTQLQTQPSQTSTTSHDSFSLPKKDTDIRVLKSEASKCGPVKETECHPMSKSQPPCTLSHGIHSVRSGHVVSDSKNKSGTKDMNETRGQGSAAAKKTKMQPTEQPKLKQSVQHQKPVEKQSQEQKQKVQKQPISQMGQSTGAPAFSAANSFSSPAGISTVTNASQSIQYPMFLPGLSSPLSSIIIPPILPQTILPLMSLNNTTPQSSKNQTKNLPTQAMMQDYAAASPKTFPHTCSLCKKRCIHMKDWLSHQNTSLHLENCKLLRIQFPQWDGELELRPSAAGKDGLISASASTTTSAQRHQKKSRRGTRSSSRSRSRSRSYSRSRSRSSSYHRHHGLHSRRDRRRSRSRSPYGSRYSRRSRTCSSSPRYSRYRSSSSSPERRLSPRRRDERRSSPRRYDERRSSPRRYDERRSSPRRHNDRRSSPRRYGRRSHERSSSPQRKRASSAERLAKKLLETSAVQSLSKESDLEAVVKTLAPAIMAELAKMKSSSASTSTSSSSSSEKTSTKLSKAKPTEPENLSEVTLTEIFRHLSHNDVASAAEQFGKVKSVVLYRSTLKAKVCFENVADAVKLRSAKSIDIKGCEVFVEGGKETNPKQHKQTPQKKHATSTASATESDTSPPEDSVPSEAKKPPVTTEKVADAKIAAKGPAKAMKHFGKSDAVVFKLKNTLPKQAKMLKTGTLPATVAVKQSVVKQTPLSGSKSTPPENQHDARLPNEKPVLEKSETIVKEATINRSADRTVTEATKQKQVIADMEKLTLTKQEPRTAEDKVTAEGTVTKETSGKAPSLPSKTTVLENHPDVENSKTKELETKVQEAEVVPKDPDNVGETANEPKQQTNQPDKGNDEKSNDAQDAEPMELGETGVEAAEPMEVGSCADGSKANLSTVPENSAETPTESQPPTGTVENQPAETNTLQKLKARSVTTVLPAVAASEQQLTVSTSSIEALTIGEMVEQHLATNRIVCLKAPTLNSPRFFLLKKRQLLITKLPKYHDGLYTEEDVARLLIPFGFEYTDNNINIVPQMCMAFVRMPTMATVHSLMKNVKGKNAIVFKGSRIRFSVLGADIPMGPLSFYKILMKLMKSPVIDDGSSIILVNNITPAEVRELRETVKKMGQVTNFLPLLNKVYVHFEYPRDADRFGVWYSLLKNAHGHQIHRLKVPSRLCTSLPPSCPENAMPDSKDAIIGATVPPTQFGVPQGTCSPFWVTMRTSPFLFPTMSPWFIIPDHLTVNGESDIEAASQHLRVPTIMLTCLPEGNYKHEDVAKQVWPYFQRKNLQSLYYNVVVLSLQGRAFVFFDDWSTCCNFARDHIKNPLSIKDQRLTVHFVLQNMHPGSTEEIMYSSLMKWSNSGVPDPTFLEERLLCVETSNTSVEVVKMVIEIVASIATFISFLPLANRICFEMANASGVTQVLERHHEFIAGSIKRRLTCTKIRQFESLKSLKERLQDNSEISFEPGTISAQTEPPDVKSQSDSESITNEPGASTDEADGEKPEVVTDTTVSSETNEDVKEEKDEEGSPSPSTPAAHVASTFAPSDSELKPEENMAELPVVKEDIFQALTAAVRQHKLTRDIRPQSEEESTTATALKICTSLRAKDTSQDMDQDDHTEDVVSSDVCLFDETNLNMCEFVTVDEIGDDGPDRSPEHHSSSSSPPRRETESSAASQSHKSPSTRSASSSSSSSKSRVKSSLMSTERSTDSSKPSKFPTKSSLSPSSTEAPSSPAHQTQPRKTNSPSKTCSSLSAQDKEKITSAGSDEASVETEASVDAVSRSDHTVSAECTAAKTVESETKLETSSLMHSPSHSQQDGTELSQSLCQEIDVNLKSGEGSKGDGVEKHEKEGEEMDSSENYKVLDSLKPTDKQMDDGNEDQDDSSESQPTGPEDGLGPHQETYQVLDSVGDEVKVISEGCGQIETEAYVKEQTATSQVDSHIVHNDGSSVQQLSEEESVPAADKSDDVGKDQEGEDKDVQTDDGEASKEVVLNLKDSDIEDTEQETFEILDSIDDQTATEDDDQKQETSSEQMCKEDIGDTGEEEDTFQVIDSVDDQPTTAESDNKERQMRKREEPEPSRRSSTAKKTASKTNESPKRQDRMFKRTRAKSTAEVSKEDKEARGETVYKIVDSVEDEPVEDIATSARPGRRRSARGKKEDKITLNVTEVSKKPLEDEEATYEILDSVEDETPDEEPAVMKRSLRGTRSRSEKTKAEDMTTRRGRSSAREKMAKKEESRPTKKSDAVVKETGEDDATYEILDSVEEEVAQEDQLAKGRKGKRGRPRKETKAAKKAKVTMKKASEDAINKVADDNEATYQILDSVDEEMVEDQLTTGLSESSQGDVYNSESKQTTDTSSILGPSRAAEEEEEPMYQIVDSLDEDQEETIGTTEATIESPTAEEASIPKEAPADARETSNIVIVKAESLCGLPKDLDEANKESPSRAEREVSQSNAETSKAEKSAEKIAPTNTLVSLDEVSDEEEDYPDDMDEEEELRKRQQTAKDQEERKSREREERGRRRRRGRKRVEEERLEMVTLDEVGADEAEEEREEEITEGELQTLVTLDEFVEEDEEGREEQLMADTRLLLQEDESGDSFNPETLVTLDEAGGDEEEKPDEEKADQTSTSAECKPDENAEESMNFVTVDEVGGEDDKEVITTRTRGQGRKRSRPARKSPRGKNQTGKDEREEEKEPADAPPSLDAPSSLGDPLRSSSDVLQEIQKTEKEAESRGDAEDTSTGQEGQREEEGSSRTDSQGTEKTSSAPSVSKERTELGEPEAKRSRSESPCVSANFSLPPFKPNNPLGQEFVTPKSGYFCNLCSIFYLTEKAAKHLHCSSQRHYDNLQNHYRKLQQKTPGGPTRTSQGSISD